MKLLFDESVCTDCGACLSTCPKKPKSLKILKCRHCSPEVAGCKAACPSKAIKESNGFLFISEEECDGCGACVRKCPQKAIILENKKAVKCDGCLGSPKCTSYCPEEAIHFFTEDEGALGWKISGDSPDYRTGIPKLTREEESVILEVSGRFREASKKGEFSDRQSAKEALDAILLQICRDSGLLMETDQFDYLSKIAFMHIWGYGPLDPLLADDRLEEIAVIGLKKPVYVYKRGEGWLSTDCVFTEQEAFVNLVNKMARPLGRRLTHQTPRLNAVLPDGSRIHASMPPLSQLELTVRKFRANPISVPDLVNFRTFSPEALAFLWLAMKTDTSIIVAGNTASGKTSTLNALFSFVPLDERVLITEETPEINIPHKHKIGLLASPELGIGMCELASDSLRMRPDRVIVGEVRTKDETKALLEAITSGQARGSYATFHAHSADEAIARMRSLGVLETDIASIGLIVVQKRIAGSGKAKEIRLVTEISELKIEAGSAKAVQLYVYDYESKSLKRTAAHDSETEREIRRAFGLSESGFKRELADRSKLLSSLAKKKRSFFETVVSIQTYERRKEDEN